MNKIQLNLDLISQSPKRWKLLSEDNKHMGTIGYKTKRYFYLTDKWLNKEKNLEEILEFEKSEIRTQLYAYLSRCEQTPKKATDWLKKRGVPQKDISILLKEVIDKDYISTERYSEIKLRKEFNKGNKPLWRIKLELQNQGIDSQNINLEYFDEKASLMNYINKNLWKLKKDKEKFKRGLIMKGFNYSLVASIIKDIIETGDIKFN